MARQVKRPVKPPAKKPRAKKPEPEPVASNDARPLVWTRAVLDSETLNKNEKKVLWAYQPYANSSNGGNAHPGDPLLARKLGVSVDTVERARKGGIAKGYLRLTKKGHGGEHPQADVYQLTIPKVPTGSTANEDPDTANTGNKEDRHTANRGSTHRKKNSTHRTHADLPHHSPPQDTSSFIHEDEPSDPHPQHHDPAPASGGGYDRQPPPLDHDQPPGLDDLGSAQDESAALPGDPAQQDSLAEDLAGGDHLGYASAAAGDAPAGGLDEAPAPYPPGSGDPPSPGTGLAEPFGEAEEDDVTQQIRKGWRISPGVLIARLVEEHPEWEEVKPVNQDWVTEQWKKAGVRLTGSIFSFAEAMNWYSHEGRGQGAQTVGYLCNPEKPGWERAVPDYYSALCREREDRDRESFTEYQRWQQLSGHLWKKGEALASTVSAATRPPAALSEKYGNLLVWISRAEGWELKKKNYIEDEAFRGVVDASAFELPPAPAAPGESAA